LQENTVSQKGMLGQTR